MTTSTTPQGVSSTGYVFLGTALCLIGTAIMVAASSASDSALAVFATFIGVAGVALMLVGLIAKGVALGIEEHRRSH